LQKAIRIPKEPIGRIPRPLALIDAIARRDGADPVLDSLYEEAIRDTIQRFEATGSPVITDGQQRKYHNFRTYCVQGLPNTAPDGFKIPFAAGHTRRMPRLTAITRTSLNRSLQRGQSVRQRIQDADLSCRSPPPESLQTVALSDRSCFLPRNKTRFNDK